MIPFNKCPNLERLILGAILCGVIIATSPTNALKTQQSDRQQELNGEEDVHSNSNKKKEPQESFEFGPLVVDVFANYSEYSDKLRLSKSYAKFVIGNKFAGAKSDPIGTMKFSEVEQLFRCENLTLARPEMAAEIECLPLSLQLFNHKPEIIVPESSIDSKSSYVRRFSYKLKNDWIGGASRRTDVLLYPLSNSATRGYIGKVLAENKLDPLGLSFVSHGSYMETRIPNSVVCSGIVLQSWDESNTRIPNEDDNPVDSTQLVKEVLGLLADGYKNGMLVSVRDFSCQSSENQMVPFSIGMDFDFIRKNQFPYLTCSHRIYTKPLEFIWKYEGKISQHRDENSPEESYNTTIKVASSSGLLDNMNFRLEQDFVNSDFQRGSERMVLVGTKFAASVVAAWDPEKLIKVLSLLILKPGEKAENIAVRDDLRVTFSNLVENDYYDLAFRIRRDILEGFGFDKNSSPEPVEKVTESDQQREEL